MNKRTFWTFGLVRLLVLAATTVVWAKGTVAEAIKKYGVTFPIVELGNCTDFDNCRTYCGDKTHTNACVDYAKKKRFYKGDEVESKKDRILAAAQTELGCGSVEACKNYCGSEENFERCTEFAKKYGMGGGQMLSPKNQQILSKAKEILGCDSPSECKALCDQEVNQGECIHFMKQAGLAIREGNGPGERKGSGGCNSPESCKAFCASPENADECEKFGSDPEGKSTRRKNGIKACEKLGPDECKQYCTEHPDECPGFWGEGGYKGPDYVDGEEYCQKNPGACPGLGDADRQVVASAVPNSKGLPPGEVIVPSVQGVSTVRSI